MSLCGVILRDTAGKSSDFGREWDSRDGWHDPNRKLYRSR